MSKIPVSIRKRSLSRPKSPVKEKSSKLKITTCLVDEIDTDEILLCGDQKPTKSIPIPSLSKNVTFSNNDSLQEDTKLDTVQDQEDVSSKTDIEIETDVNNNLANTTVALILPEVLQQALPKLEELPQKSLSKHEDEELPQNVSNEELPQNASNQKIPQNLSKFEVVPQDLPPNFELDINNNPVRTSTTLSILPSFKVLQVPISAAGDTIFKSVKPFPTKTHSRRTILLAKLSYSPVTRTTICPRDLSVDSKETSAADYDNTARDYRNSDQSTVLLLQINKSLQRLRESSGEASDDDDDESILSSFTNYFKNFDYNLESEILTGVLGLLGSTGGELLKSVVGAVDNSDEFMPTDTLTYNGYKFVISGRGILMKSLKFNEQYHQNSATFGKNYRIGLEIGLKKRGPPASHPPKKILTDTSFTLRLNFPEEFEETCENFVKVYVPAGVSTKLVKWKVFGDVLVVGCP